MKATVFFTANEVEGADLEGHTAVVIDVLRATSSIVAALESEAHAIFPVDSTDEAVKLANSLGRGDTLLAGERKGLKIEGFDLGNSPAEFGAEAVFGKRIVMTTTNGTRALVAASAAERVLVASFGNLSAVAHECAKAERLAIVCAGKEERFALEDALCAGMLLGRLEEWLGDEVALDETARVALMLADAFGIDADFLADTASGRALIEIGHGGDLEWCARVDVSTLVPELDDRTVRRARGAA